MNSEKWLLKTNPIENKYSDKINKLTSLYIQAFHDFFNITPTENMEVFLVAANKQCEKKSDYLFLDWLKNKGFIQLKKLMELNLPYDTTVASKINLVLGALKDDLNWDERDKKSTRSTVVNTLTNLTENLIHLSNIALEKEEIKLINYTIERKPNFDFISNTISQPLETVVVLILKLIGGFPYEQQRCT